MGIWLRRLAILAVLGFPIAVLGTRSGIFDFTVGFKIITWTVYLSLAVLLVSLIASLMMRKSNPSGSKASVQAMLLCLLPIVGIGSQLVTARSLPQIHNITTDPADPPQFNAVVALRGEGANPLEYDATILSAQQQEAYPELETLITDDDAATAFDKALLIAQELGWEIIASEPEQGIIEATDTTALWNFKDDVVIRVRDIGAQREIDLRSVSRVGRSDLGANAKRITTFLQAYQD